jgi:phosphoribosyl-AMP cyclohydrolase
MSNADWPDFSKNELIPAIAQDAETGDVLMMAWMNEEAFNETLATGRVVYFSRSRQKLWRKGEESGNVQELKGLYFDCDADTFLVKVNQIGQRSLKAIECLTRLRSTANNSLGAAETDNGLHGGCHF